MDPDQLIIRKAESDDADAMRNIYNYYILNSIATFEEKVISLNEMEERIIQTTVNYPWLIAEHNSKLIGFAYGNQWKSRSAYKFTVESSIYLNPDNMQKGFGTYLYSSLINTLKTKGFASILGGISLPNDASIRLHEKLGFQHVGTLKKVGYKFNTWIDVGYWELIF